MVGRAAKSAGSLVRKYAAISAAISSYDWSGRSRPVARTIPATILS
jgi:hypothetical protein